MRLKGEPMRKAKLIPPADLTTLDAAHTRLGWRG